MSRQTSHDNVRSSHVDEIDFLVVDVETTGLSPQSGDRVCEVGAVKLRGGAVMETFNSLIDPRRPISGGAYAVNRISPEMLVNAPIFETIAPKLREMMNGAVVVAYNAPFDVGFLSAEFQFAGFPVINNYVIDALVIARQLLPGLNSYAQEQVARVTGVAPTVKHRALDDAMVTAQLFCLFISVLKAYGYSQCGDLQRRDIARLLETNRLTIIDRALSGGQDLWIRYISPAGPEIAQTIVTPRGCSNGRDSRNSGNFLVAYCHTSRVVKDFRIDRILDIRVIE